MTRFPVAKAIIAVCLFLVPGGVGLGGPVDANVNKREAMAKHRGFFKDAYERYRTPEKRVYTVLEKLASDTPLSTEEWEGVLSTLVNDSEWGLLPGSQPRSGIVQNVQVVDVLVAALQDSGATGKQYVIDVLTWEVSGKMRKRYADEIQKALGYGPHLATDPKMLALLATCGLTPEQKTEILTWDRVPPMVRAVCGDKQAETGLILAFEQSGDWQNKRKLARELAYVGTEPCAKALIDGLRSPVFWDGQVDQISIRPKILRALGMIYEDEKLFTTDAFVVDTSYDFAFDKSYGMKRYSDAVDRWVQERFGHSAWGDGDVWFKRFK